MKQPKRGWREYRLYFQTGSKKDVNMYVRGPNGGEHWGGAWTLDELIEAMTDGLNEAIRRKELIRQEKFNRLQLIEKESEERTGS